MADGRLVEKGAGCAPDACVMCFMYMPWEQEALAMAAVAE